MGTLAGRLLAGLLLALALLTGGYLKGRSDESSKVAKEILASSQEARQIEQKRQLNQQAINDAKDAALRRVNARLSAALVSLRDRPERMPEAAREACQGGTGRELSGPDAGFLEGFAARAEALREALRACQEAQ